MEFPVIDLDALLADIPRGAWVAISEASNRVLAFGPDAQQVVDSARAQGEAVPLLTRVPEVSTMLFF